MRTKNAIVEESVKNRFDNVVPGRYVTFSVSDTGSGMDENVMSHLFEPFFTTKPKTQGTGLGLSTLFGIIKQHNGFIDVVSEPDKGAVFTIYMSEDLGPEDEEPVRQEFTAPENASRRILVVEDDDSIRILTEKILTDSGYMTASASDILDAGKIFDSSKDGFDLLITDVVLKSGNGLSLAKGLLAKSPKLKVMFMSGYTDEYSKWQEINKLGYTFLHKPFTRSELLENIHTTLGIPG